MVAEIRERIEGIDEEVRLLEGEKKRVSKGVDFYRERADRLERIQSLLSESAYMKKVSSSISLYFKNIERLVFCKTLLRLGLNEWVDDDVMGDYELCRDIFTGPIELHTMRKRYGLHHAHTFEELKILSDTLEESRGVRLVEDRHGILREEIVGMAGDRGYQVEVFSSGSYQEMLSYIQAKLRDHDNFVLIQDSVHYLERHCAERQRQLEAFVAELLSVLKTYPISKHIIVVTNYLPPANSQHYASIDLGRATLSSARFYSDFTDSFNVITARERVDARHRQGDLDAVLAERSSKMKELMNHLDRLCQCIAANDGNGAVNGRLVGNEWDGCEVVENSLGEVMALEEDVEWMEAGDSSYLHKNRPAREQVQHDVEHFYLLYCLTDQLNTVTNTQFFPGTRTYIEWLKLLRAVCEEHPGILPKQTFAHSHINEITIRNTTDPPPIEVKKSDEEAVNV